MIFKTGCVVYNIVDQVDTLLHDDGILDEIFREEAGRDCFVTSVRNGKHATWSLHYKGRALDCRANDLTKSQQQRILARLKAALPGFDVILHGKGRNIHYHIEWDPK